MATANITKRFPIYPTQQAFIKSQAIFKAFVGGIGSGKSHIGAYDVIRRAKPNRLYLVTAPTYTMLSDASFRSFTAVGQNLDMIQNRSIKRGAPPSLRLINGAEVIFRSTDDPENLRGPNISGIWMDEASRTKKDAHDILIGRLREAGEQGWMTATFTPKGKTHWTYDRFGKGEIKTPLGCKSADGMTELFIARTEDNPFLPPNFAANVRSKYSAKQAAQELEGKFLDAGGNHFFPGSWPRYQDIGDAFRLPGEVIRKSECTLVIALDWAVGKRKRKATAETEDKGDFTAFVVAYLADDGRIFIIDVINERLKLELNAPKLEELCNQYRPAIVAGDDDMLSEAMLLDCRRYRIPEIRCLPIASKSKLTRAQSAIIHGENGRIYLPPNAMWMEGYCDQLGSFTGIEAEDEHDDMVDCTGIIGRLADDLKFEQVTVMPEVFSPGRNVWGYQ